MHVIDDETRRFGRLLHYAGLLIAVICAALGYSLVHAPMVGAVMETAAKIEELQLSLHNAPVAREQHQKISEKLRDVTTRIAEVQRRVPRDSNAGEFLTEVMQLAEAQQLKIKEFQPDKSESRVGYSEMRVTLKGAGSYASICAFLDGVSKLTRLSKVKELTVAATEDAADYPMTATLIIYFGLQGKDEAARASAVRGSVDPAARGATTALPAPPRSAAASSGQGEYHG